MVDEGQGAVKPSAPVAVRRESRVWRWLVVAAAIVSVLLVIRGGASLLGSTVLNARIAGIEGRSDLPASLVTGRRLFAEDCAPCHGAGGDRIATAPLNSTQFTNNLGPRLEQAIANGRGSMAAWGRDRGGPMTSSEVKSVAEYIRGGINPSGGAADAPVIPSPVVATTPTAAPTQTPAVPARTPPAIPHLLADQANRCLDCHAKGGVRPMPVNHAGRTNAMCPICHAQSQAAPVPAAPGTPTAVSR